MLENSSHNVCPTKQKTNVWLASWTSCAPIEQRMPLISVNSSASIVQIRHFYRHDVWPVNLSVTFIDKWPQMHPKFRVITGRHSLIHWPQRVVWSVSINTQYAWTSNLPSSKGHISPPPVLSSQPLFSLGHIQLRLKFFFALKKKNVNLYPERTKVVTFCFSSFSQRESGINKGGGEDGGGEPSICPFIQ